MNEITRLIEAAEQLCLNLERASQQENHFCEEIALMLERYSWETLRMTNDMKEMQYRFGG